MYQHNGGSVDFRMGTFYQSGAYFFIPGFLD